MTATRNKYPTKAESVRYLAFELADAHWKLGFTTGFGQKPRLRTIGAGDIAALEDEVALAKKRFRLKASVRMVSCYEAGRDGFGSIDAWKVWGLRMSSSTPRASRSIGASGSTVRGCS